MYPSRYRIAFYAVILLLGCLTALPNILPKSALDEFPGWLPQRQVTLGLDLKGGSHLVLEIDGLALAKDQLDTLRESVRMVVRTTRAPGVSITAGNGAVTVRVAEAKDREVVQRALRTLVGNVGPSIFGGSEPDIEVATAANGDFIVRRTSSGLMANQRGGSRAKPGNRPPPDRRGRRGRANDPGPWSRSHPGAVARSAGSETDQDTAGKHGEAYVPQGQPAD